MVLRKYYLGSDNLNKYLAIDIGGTFIKYGEYLEDGTELTNLKESTPKNPEAFIDILTEIIIKHEKIKGVAISCPGFINPVTGENTDFSVGENIKKYNLKAELKRRTKYDISVENDGKCAALAENWLGRGKNYKNLIVITLGTGVGGGIIVNKKLYRGQNFKAGEFGFMIIGKEEGEVIYPPSTSRLIKWVNKEIGKEVTGEYIFENYSDPIIQRVYQKWLERVAITIGNLAVSFDSEMVLVGGGISASDLFIEDLKKETYSIFKHLKEYTLIDRCLLQNNAGKIGALYNYLLENRIYEAIDS